MARRAAISRRLVVDASIARAAGQPASRDPTASICRKLLLVLLEVCHRVVMTSDLKAEWQRNASRFALTWRRQMCSRKKLVSLGEQRDSAFRIALQEAAAGEFNWAAMLRDAHLIEAARAADRTVISLDEAARRLFLQASSGVAELGTVCWVNPAGADVDVLVWLEGGAEWREELRLVPRTGR